MTPRILLLILLSVFSNMAKLAKGQSDAYHPLLQNGKSWIADRLSSVGDESVKIGKYETLISGDTIINGKEWKKCYSDEAVSGVYDYYGALRQDGERIYVYKNSDTRERLLYDFGVKPGDVLYRVLGSGDLDGLEFLVTDDNPGSAEEADYYYRPSIDKMTVKCVDTIRVNGIPLRRILFKSDWKLKSSRRLVNTTTYPDLYWLEGIGSQGGLLHPWSTRELSANPEWEFICQIDDRTIFEYKDFFESAPDFPKTFDVNQDNTIDISDIVAVINVIAGTDSTSKADVNADGKVDISDIVAIINAIAK